MALRETGKQRAVRIPLDYFKRRSKVERWKLSSALGAAVLATLWWGGGYLTADRGVSRYSHGPLAAVHATWETECLACHEDFVQRQGDAWTGLWPVAARSADAKCLTCHLGPAHYPTQKPDMVPGSAGCHHDHSGRAARLAWVPDASCTGCHANLAAATAGQPRLRPPLADVTRFDVDHPDFRSARADPGHLKFSHWRHLLPGMTQGPGDKTPPWTLAQTASDQRERYRRPGQRDQDPVVLDCRSCHQLDSSGFGIGSVPEMPAAVLPARSDGARMLPITYENQCRACHPLPVTPGSATADSTPPAPEMLPHRLSPDQIRTLIRRVYAGALVDQQPALLDKYLPPRPLPGASWLGQPEQARQRIEEKVVRAEAFVRQVCLKCHEAKKGDIPHLPERPEGCFAQMRDVPFFPVPTAVPLVWLKYARFDHMAHRAVDCRQCHARAYADDSQASRVAADVLIPHRDVCVQCHARRVQTSSGACGGARFECVECHAYHAGDRPLEGKGSPLRDAAVKSPIRSFLSGQGQEH